MPYIDKEAKAAAGRKYYLANKEKILQQTIAYYHAHKEQHLNSGRKRRENNPEDSMLYAARGRAKKSNVPCTITAKDIVIPTVCPALGIPLVRNFGGKRMTASSPSLDRFVPELGYVPGNVFVISNRANTIKNNATLAELKSLVSWVELNSASLN